MIEHDGIYQLQPQGYYSPAMPPAHRDEEYDPAGFDVLLDMQLRHFWYRGRHRFLLNVLRRMLRGQTGESLSAIDLGGGCGGWVSYLNARAPGLFGELALSDSSPQALNLAGPVVGPSSSRYQIDLLNLGWENRWDVAFLLDVLEHIPDDRSALQQIYKSLRPGGLLLITTPALKFFWSHNDEMARHVRRYSREGLESLGQAVGFEPVLTRYFMFFLSPLLLASRWKRVDVAAMSPEEIHEYMSRTHRVPAAPLNEAMSLIFGLETPLGRWLPFPWGTSVLAVLHKP